VNLSAATRAASATLLALWLLAGCATDQLHRAGLAAIDEGRYVEGISMLEQAAQNDPGNATYNLDLKARREAAVQRLIAAADTARGAAQLEQAEGLYRDVLTIEPGNSRAQRGVEGVAADRRHADLIAQARLDLDRGEFEQAESKVRAVLAENPGFAAANALRAQIDAARGPVNVVRRLRPRDDSPVTLQFREANTMMVFEVLSRQTGINFVFDSDVRTDGKTTIFVQDVPVEQAIELILGQNQLGRQVMSENMVMIYPNTEQKRRDYEDQIVKAIYLTNAEPAQVDSMLKTVLNVQTTFVDERAKGIIIRDTPETVRMAEKLIASLDLPEPEVMMEVEVLEITRSRLQQLGINYPSSLSYSMTSPDGGPFTRNDYDRQNGDTILATPLSVSVDVLKQVGLTNLLASPRIRARNHETASILIGSRVPVITNSVTPTGTGAAVVTGNVQYLDVGLTLEVEPTIYLDGEVAINFDFEISTIVREVRSGGGSDGNGTLAYEIGTRNASTLLRLRDGETQILAGLIQDRDTQNSSHIPGLGDIPILGRLFGSKRDTNDKTEIVLSITPRIIRSQPRPSSEDTEFWYGTESSNRSAPLGAMGVANAADAGAGVDLGETGSAQAASAVLTAPAARAPGVVPAAPTIGWEAPGQAGVGQPFDVRVRMSGGDPLQSVRAQLRYDPAVLELVSAEPGDTVPSDIRASTVPRINENTGVVQLVANATAARPLSNDGDLMTLHFNATTPNPASRISVSVVGVGTNGATVSPAAQQPLTIEVTP
jgi:general secretion pathway protein D